MKNSVQMFKSHLTPYSSLFYSLQFLRDNNPILATTVHFQNVTLQCDVAVCDDIAMLKALKLPQPPAPDTGAANGL